MRRIRHWGRVTIVKAPYALSQLGENSTHAVIEYPVGKTLRGVRLENVHTGFSGSFKDCLDYVEKKYGIDTRLDWQKEMDDEWN